MSITGPSFTVVLVGDDAFRQRAEPLLQERDKLLVIGSVDADAAVATTVGRSPDVVVIAEPPASETSAAELAVQVGAALPASRILVVTQGGPAPDPSGLIDAWAGGVLDLDAGPLLADAVEWVAMGEGVVDAGLAQATLDRHRATADGVPLTATEDEVLTRLAGGAEVDALATEYAVTPRLVRLHAGGALVRLHPPA